MHKAKRSDIDVRKPIQKCFVLTRVSKSLSHTALRVKGHVNQACLRIEHKRFGLFYMDAKAEQIIIG